MRTTLYIDDSLLAEAKSYAHKQGRTLTAVVQDSLREVLARRRSSKRKIVKLTTSKGGRVLPGIDLDDSAALWDHMDLEEWRAKQK